MFNNHTSFSGCGIAGIMLSHSNFIPDELKQAFHIMLDSLKHRGPDGSGVYYKNNVILGHRRLSILDVSEKGAQPMTRDHLTITLNGEVYNFKEIRKELQDEGYHFFSDTDTEVVLRSYQKWGANALHKFNGMFAFAIWDDNAKSLFIARDRIGKKPFYYYSNAGIFVFASEVSALIKSGLVQPEIDYSTFEHQLFATSFLEVDQKRNLIKNVKSLLPGHYMNVNLNGTVKQCKYWDLPETTNYDNVSVKNLNEKLDYLLNDSINLRLVSDVPVSAFLSGGIDSSLINYYAANQTNEKLTSITVDYNQSGKDPYSEEKDMDLLYSKQFVQHFSSKVNHEIVSITNSDITIENIDNVIDLSSLSDDDRMLSILKNYECVKNLGYKVVLNGQGADEIMCGYIGLRYFYETMFDVKQPNIEMIEKMFPGRTIAKNILNPELKNKSTKVYQDVYDCYYSHIGSPVEKIHRFLTKTQLSRILKFEDLLSMKHSVECRLPFLDYRVIEFAFSIPYNLHFEPETRTGKIMLREISKNKLPDSIVSRPKQAFPASYSNEKKHQLYTIISNNYNEITQCDLIQRYFNLSEIKNNTVSLHELWLILVVWRWETKLKKLTSFKSSYVASGFVQ
jgi:asparagine synthase (glutamine-hydrolysing)